VKHVAGYCIKALFFGCLVAALFVPGTVVSVQAAEPIKIGVILSLTGRGGFMGAPQKDAMLAIVDDVNKHGGVAGGRPIELLVEDDQTIATNAVIAGTKLIRDKNVSIIVGPSTVEAGWAMIPICEKEEVPIVLTAPVSSPFKKWAFCLGSGDDREAISFLDLIVKKLGAKRIALFTSVDTHGKTGGDTVTKEIAKYPGVSIVAHEKGEGGDTNVIPQLTNIKAAKPDAILLFSTGALSAIVARNYAQLGMTTPVVTSPGAVSPEFVKIAGTVAEKYKWIMHAALITVADKYPPDHPVRKNVYEPFKKALQARLGPSAQPNPYQAVCHDGLRAAIEAIKLANSDDRKAVRDALEKTRFDGFLGHFAPTATRHQCSPEPSMVPMVLKGGVFYPWQQ
jgi:branched-chain amino acid transport system substrate-binding protein